MQVPAGAATGPAGLVFPHPPRRKDWTLRPHWLRQELHRQCLVRDAVAGARLDPDRWGRHRHTRLGRAAACALDYPTGPDLVHCDDPW